MSKKDDLSSKPLQQFGAYDPLITRLRPRNWDEVEGQAAAVRSLKNMIIRGSVPRAILFEGDRGLGKTTCARILTARLNCREADKNDPNPCGQCASCKGVISGRAGVLIHEIDCGTTNKVEEIRTLIDQAEYGSGDQFRVFILDEFHHVTDAGKTALLKSLEEPNPNVKWLLATTEGHKISQTIRSRCTSIVFRSLACDTMTGYLKRLLERLTKDGVSPFQSYDEEALQYIAEISDGSVRQAQSFMEQLIAYGGDTLTTAAVQTVTGRTQATDIGLFMNAIIAGHFVQADRMIKNLYNDNFTNDLLAYLYRDYLPRQGTSADRRRQVAQVLRALNSYKPVYSYGVNRDGLLFVMLDAVHGDTISTSQSEPAKTTTRTKEKTKARSKPPADAHGDERVAELFGMMKDKKVLHTVLFPWDGDRSIIEVDGDTILILRRGNLSKPPTEYVLPYKSIKSILSSDIGDFRVQELVKRGIILKTKDL